MQEYYQKHFGFIKQDLQPELLNQAEGDQLMREKKKQAKEFINTEEVKILVNTSSDITQRCQQILGNFNLIGSYQDLDQGNQEIISRSLLLSEQLKQSHETLQKQNRHILDVPQNFPRLIPLLKNKTKHNLNQSSLVPQGEVFNFQQNAYDSLTENQSQSNLTSKPKAVQSKLNGQGPLLIKKNSPLKEKRKYTKKINNPPPPSKLSFMPVLGAKEDFHSAYLPQMNQTLMSQKGSAFFHSKNLLNQQLLKQNQALFLQQQQQLFQNQLQNFGYEQSQNFFNSNFIEGDFPQQSEMASGQILGSTNLGETSKGVNDEDSLYKFSNSDDQKTKARKNQGSCQSRKQKKLVSSKRGKMKVSVQKDLLLSNMSSNESDARSRSISKDTQFQQRRGGDSSIIKNGLNNHQQSSSRKDNFMSKTAKNLTEKAKKIAERQNQKGKVNQEQERSSSNLPKQVITTDLSAIISQKKSEKPIQKQLILSTKTKSQSESYQLMPKKSKKKKIGKKSISKLKTMVVAKKQPSPVKHSEDKQQTREQSGNKLKRPLRSNTVLPQDSPKKKKSLKKREGKELDKEQKKSAKNSAQKGEESKSREKKHVMPPVKGKDFSFLLKDKYKKKKGKNKKKKTLRTAESGGGGGGSLAQGKSLECSENKMQDMKCEEQESTQANHQEDADMEEEEQKNQKNQNEKSPHKNDESFADHSRTNTFLDHSYQNENSINKEDQEEEQEDEEDDDEEEEEESELSKGNQDSKKTKSSKTQAGKGSKIIVKISNLKCLLFDIFSKKVEKGFSGIKAPESLRSKTSIVLTNSDKIFIIGGEDKGVYLGKNYEYNYVSQEFTERSQMLEARVTFGCIHFNGLIFIAGGWKEQYLQRSECYNIHLDQWIEMSPLNEEREDVSLCVVHDRYIYAFGNVTTRGRRFKQNKTLKGQGQNVQKFQEYSIERIVALQQGDKWEIITINTSFTEIDRMPSMKHMGCFNFYSDPNKIILFGGGSGQNISDKGYYIDIEQGTLNKYSKLARADRFQNHLLVKKDDKLLVFGEFYLHILNLSKERWLKDPVPLNSQALNSN